MDAIDRRLLTVLETDGRASFAQIAEAAGLSKTPCWNRVQALEEKGVIMGYRAEIDRASVGLPLLAFIDVAIDLGRHEAFEAAVAEVGAVLECHTTAGPFDYVLRVAVRDVGALDDLLRAQLSRLPGVKNFATRICLKTVFQARPLMANAGS
ncbi:Lrp/AsnC family leucine-responsive transcriptional regulator [Nitrospirillum iridis]|uniref:Lrp/AsnC family leucine-responsive transcriptional regulator n=1 Tax=Nitrospirillum iridis TaxID=765888 RepID=A0A7X0EGZ6_9PROT|nr:Lrp/AsnC family leucine-responsive transcriptional regulator [Nitrospirillum iridis]